MKQRFAALGPLVLLVGLAAGFGLWVALRWVGPQPRVVDATRVEKSLRALVEFRRTGDEARLRADLDVLGMTRSEFERIVDRFIHYRVSSSAMAQARKLLEAFKDGHTILPEGVLEEPQGATPSFQLDAEILTVLTENPELVKKAFGS